MTAFLAGVSLAISFFCFLVVSAVHQNTRQVAEKQRQMENGIEALKKQVSTLPSIVVPRTTANTN